MLKTRKPEFTSEEAAAAVLVVWLVTKYKLLRFVRAENNWYLATRPAMSLGAKAASCTENSSCLRAL